MREKLPQLGRGSSSLTPSQEGEGQTEPEGGGWGLGVRLMGCGER